MDGLAILGTGVSVSADTYTHVRSVLILICTKLHRCDVTINGSNDASKANIRHLDGSHFDFPISTAARKIMAELKFFPKCMLEAVV